MPRNGSGTYSLPAGNPVVTGTTISSTVHNNTMNDLRDAMTASIAKDGQTTHTGNLKMGSTKLTSLAAGTAANDSVRLTQVQDSAEKLIGTVAGTNTITGGMTPALTAYASGQTFILIPANDNTGATTINIDSLGAKNIFNHGAACVGGEMQSGEPILIEYDGTQFNLIGGPQVNYPEIVTFSKAPVGSVPIYIDPLLRPICSLDTDTDHDINVTAGTIADSTGKYVIELTSEITKRADATWAAGDDAGGMNDTNFAELGGAPFATDRYTVHVFLLGKTDGSGADVGFDDDITATNLLADTAVIAAGYTLYRRIGSLLFDASDNWLGFTQYGSYFYLDDTYIIDEDAPATPTNVASGAPDIAEGLVLFGDVFGTGGAGGGTSVAINAGATGPGNLISRGSASELFGNQWVWSVGASNNLSWSYTGNDPTADDFRLHGWIDNLDLA